MDRSSPASSDDGAPSPEPEPATSDDGDAGDDRHGAPAGAPPPPVWLTRFVEHELVPRLLGAARAPARRHAPADALRPADVDALVELLLADDIEGCNAWIDALRAAGVGADRLCDELIAPTVRALGERWDDDRCDFAQVSIGLGRLRSLVHRVGADASGGVRSRPTGRMLVATLPGRDHLLGAVIVADAFRRAGWDVSFDPGAGEATLLDAVGERRFDVIGLSVGLERDGPAVRALLAALRAASLNPGVTTMVGGPALRLRPALRAELGADLAATDAREAVACAALALRARSRASDARAGAPPLPAQRTVAAPAADPRTTPPPAGARRRRARLRRDAALRRAGAIGVPGAPAG